jgi:predicted TIM-barrel fold metal-dependent hydrolase
MHCDPVVIDALFEHAPDVTVIWAHAGAYPYPPLLRDYLERYPGLHMDLSVRDERIAPSGEIESSWELLLMEFPDRFLVGVDTYSTARWKDYPKAISRTRAWLKQLPPEAAAAISRENAERLFSRRPRD